MTLSSVTRVSPEMEALVASIKPPEPLPSTVEEDGTIRLIPNGRVLPCPAPKAWVSEAVPPGSSDELSAPAIAIHYYRQRRDFDGNGETSAVLDWLATLLCMPRLGSGRLRSPSTRVDSVDSVDFVSTWQKAQVEAAARRVVPVLKRATDATPPVPNTPELSMRGEIPPACSMVSSTLGSVALSPSESDDRSISLAAPVQRPSSSTVSPPSDSSTDLLKYDSDTLPQCALNSRNVGRSDSHQSGKRSVRFH
ncbi:hypothetical protein Vretimale_4566 [Volvox reticuliferus]|uniref:Uncharacterized protein n=1 Tax=Volvox reticuliferus TaxID=1737510 RepID=A0A8J4DE67_9CHLO|nr:hypothetical protein Vretimale_4566 [Volvox reticuliferus]